jgi:hypothetical protein
MRLPTLIWCDSFDESMDPTNAPPPAREKGWTICVKDAERFLRRIALYLCVCVLVVLGQKPLLRSVGFLEGQVSGKSKTNPAPAPVNGYGDLK